MSGAAAHRMGLGMATAVVAGNLIGSGIYLLPATLGAIGSISIYGWLISTVGALLLAGVFAMVFQLRPTEDGLADIARDGMGPYWALQASLLYWLGLWLGVIAIALAVTGYLAVPFPVLDQPGWREGTTVVVIWLATLLSIVGAKAIGRFHTLTLLVGLVPLLVAGVLGWLWFDPDLFAASWNVSGASDMEAVSGSLVSVFWAFLGVECAAMVARMVDNPKRNVPLATIGGVIIAAVVYMLASTAIFGMVPAVDLVTSSAPFALAVNTVLGPAAAGLVALCAILKASGTLAGWTLVTGETTRWTAMTGGLPRWLLPVGANGSPVRALLAMAVIMTVALVATASPTLAEQFTLLINASVVFNLLVYGYAAISLVRFAKGEGASRRRLAWLLAVPSFLFCFGLIATSGTTLIVTTLVLALLTVPLWLYVRGRLPTREG